MTREEAQALTRGDRIAFERGTEIKSMHPQEAIGWYPAGRRTVVTFHHAIGEYNEPAEFHRTELRWAGSGGYWKSVRACDAEVVR